MVLPPVKLNEDAATCAVTFFEFFWRTAFFLFEDPVEIGNVVEAAVVSYFRDAMCCIDKHPGSVT